MSPRPHLPDLGAPQHAVVGRACRLRRSGPKAPRAHGPVTGLASKKARTFPELAAARTEFWVVPVAS
eukprot:10457514-Alexandrium_andersonii.AAC.1